MRHDKIPSPMPVTPTKPEPLDFPRIEVKNVSHPVKKRSAVIGGHKTSLSLEDPFWFQLRKFAASLNRPVEQVAFWIDDKREGRNLSSAIRQTILELLLQENAELKRRLVKVIAERATTTTEGTEERISP